MPSVRSTADTSTGTHRSTPSARGMAPFTGVLVIALTVVLAAVAAGGLFVASDVADATEEPPARVTLSLSVSDGVLSLTHRGGDALDVSMLRVAVTVDGEPLTHQPPVPFFSAPGFHSGPTGPFNPSSDSQWTAGETATLSVAETNQPALADGGVVTVRVYTADALVAELSARV